MRSSRRAWRGAPSLRSAARIAFSGAALILTSCASTPRAADQARREPTVPTHRGNEPLAGAVSPSAEVTLDLTADQRATIPAGSVMLLGAGYEHLADSRNASNANVEVCRHAQCQRIYVERLHPGEVMFVRVLDVEIALVSAEAYHQPSQAQVIVRW